MHFRDRRPTDWERATARAEDALHAVRTANEDDAVGEETASRVVREARRLAAKGNAEAARALCAFLAARREVQEAARVVASSREAWEAVHASRVAEHAARAALDAFADLDHLTIINSAEYRAALREERS